MKKLFCLVLTCLPLAATARDVVSDSLGLAGAVGSPAEILAGKVAGVNLDNSTGSPLGETVVRIRGLNTIRQDAQPLYIVDGVKLNTDLKMNRKAFWQYSDAPSFEAIDPLAFLAAADIQSMEVIKDASATAIYGSDGANGVVIISTKNAQERGHRIKWTSNLGGSRGGVAHNHNLQFTGNNGNTRYSIAGNFRHRTGSDSRTGSNYGGLRFNLATSAGKVFDIGVNAILSAGNTDSGLDFDDDAMEYRALANALVRVNFTKSLHWENNFSADFQDNTRSIWYGSDTEFGRANGNAVSKLSSVTAGWNISSSLVFDRYFRGGHRLVARGGGEFLGKFDIFNTLNGSEVSSEELRARGINLTGTHFYPRVYEFNRSRLAAFATVEYDCDKIAGVRGTFRAEWSRRYSDKPIFYPSAEAYFDISRLLFRDFKGVSELKLTAGWGVSGKEQFLPYGMAGDYLFTTVPSITSGTEGFYECLMRLNTREWTAGVQTGFLSDRIRLSAKYYSRGTEDRFELRRFGQPALDKGELSLIWIYRGSTVDFTSVCDLANRGVEVEFNVTPVLTKGCRLDLFGNVARNVNSVTGAEAEQAMSGFKVPGLVAAAGIDFFIGRFSAQVLGRGVSGAQYLGRSADYCRLSRAALSYDIPLAGSGRFRRIMVKAGYTQSLPGLHTAFAGASLTF